MLELDPTPSRYADPGGVERYHKLEAALTAGGVPLDFQVGYAFNLTEQGSGKITFARTVLLELPEADLDEIGVFLRVGLEHLVTAARADRLARAEDLLKVALDQFIEFGSPEIPIRSTLRLLKGEDMSERVLVAAHVEAGLVLDMLTRDEGSTESSYPSCLLMN